MQNYQLPGVVLSPCVQTFIELLLNEAAEGDKGVFAACISAEEAAQHTVIGLAQFFVRRSTSTN
jgi:hypothetical protein